jgi:hypothetical protein
MKRANRLVAILCLSLPLPLAAQEDSRAPHSVNEGTLIGIGNYNVRNEYISDSKYTGLGMQVLNERMKIVSWKNHPVSSQQMFRVDLSYTQNPAGTVSALSGIADYSFGYHYRFQPAQGLKLLAGASLRGMFGFIYNTQAANNSTSINADIDLNLSFAALYSFRLKNYPLTLRYQIDSPFAGVFFAPGYEQSYYEIFGLGNLDGVVKLSSFHNKFAARNYLTVDFPVWNFTLRTGYLNSLYYTDINGNRTHHVSHSLMIGLVKEFISFSGKRLKKTHLYQSAYY